VGRTGGSASVILSFARTYGYQLATSYKLPATS
jgi:hypothetical protein